MNSRSGHNPSTSQGAGAYCEAAAPGVPASRGSGPLRSGQGGAEGPEVDRLRQRVLVLDIALGLETGGDATAQAGNQGVLARLSGRLGQLKREVSDLHERVDRQAFSFDLDEAFRQIRRVESLQPRPEPPLARSEPYAHGTYPAYSAYAPGVRSYEAPPAYDFGRGLAV
ncbi:hypothetical protein L916_04190 [Phytophthora nicotianae]|uniref:Uncharacterized protein n=1 Tax=Phytophthora nicotianae TaxID=4792 RepID=W2JH72_PHYNI|nr:hypothetical protein L916_04190 [Phytophthora nicotianae]